MFSVAVSTLKYIVSETASQSESVTETGTMETVETIGIWGGHCSVYCAAASTTIHWKHTCNAPTRATHCLTLPRPNGFYIQGYSTVGRKVTLY